MKKKSKTKSETWEIQNQPIGEMSENRHLPRFRDPELDNLHTALRQKTLARIQKVRLEDYSSRGFSVTIPISNETDSLLQEAQWVPGVALDLEVGWIQDQVFGCPCEIRNARITPEGLRLGLQRKDMLLSSPDWSAVPQLNVEAFSESSRRQGQRINLAMGALLGARLSHPFLYRNVCRLIAEDINGALGFSFKCEDPRLLLFPGQIIELSFDLPGQTGGEYRGRVAWISPLGKAGIRFGLQCLDIPLALHDALCRYLIASQRLSPHQLRGMGFLPRTVKDLLRFRTVNSREDYGNVLTLRRDAYVAAGRLPAGTRVESMANPLDGRSRILMAQSREKLVGSITLTFPVSHDVLDTEKGFPGSAYPVSMPPKTSLIEVARLCISPDYQDTDVLQGLFQQSLKHLLLSDRDFLVTSSVAEILPFYKRIGFKEVGAVYPHPLLQGRPHHLLLAHRNDFLLGRSISLASWGFFFADVVQHLLSEKLISVSPMERLRVEFQSILLPWIRKREAKKGVRQFNRHLVHLRTLAH